MTRNDNKPLLFGILFSLTVTGLVGLSPGQATEIAPIQYFSALPDLPLPPKMQENTDLSIDYTVGSLRILQLSAIGSGRNIQTFYQETLPMLGWVKTGPDQYQRDQDLLHFTVVKQGQRTELHIRITPAAKPTP